MQLFPDAHAEREPACERGQRMRWVRDNEPVVYAAILSAWMQEPFAAEWQLFHLRKVFEEIWIRRGRAIARNRARKRNVPKALKVAVWKRDHGDAGTAMCGCCGITEISALDFDAGHIVAEAEGGETVLSNLVAICRTCNTSMGTQHLLEFRDRHFEGKK